MVDFGSIAVLAFDVVADAQHDVGIGDGLLDTVLQLVDVGRGEAGEVGMHRLRIEGTLDGRVIKMTLAGSHLVDERIILQQVLLAVGVAG
jgi:hypothetical protein